MATSPEYTYHSGFPRTRSFCILDTRVRNRSDFLTLKRMSWANHCRNNKTSICSCLPERTACRLMGDPKPLDPVAQAFFCNSHRSASCHQSRSGPAVEFGEGVSQQPFSGKYDFCSNISVPDQTPCSSDTSDLVGPSSDRFGSGTVPISNVPPPKPPDYQPLLPETATSPCSPERTACRLMGDLSPLDPVASAVSSQHHYLVSCHQSRSGPGFESGEGVLQPSLSGKYAFASNSSLPDRSSCSSATLDSVAFVSNRFDSGTTPACNPILPVLTNNQSSRSDAASSSCLPERTACRLMGDLEPLDPVAPAASYQHHRPASCHQSRSGPAVESGVGVPQPPFSGKYALASNSSLPDQPPCSSAISDLTALMTFKSASDATVSPKQAITIYYQNVGGMNSSIDDYRLAVSDSCYDVIVLTETWLNSRTLSCQVFGSDYEVFRCDRNSNNSRKSTGGGVLVAVHSGLKAKTIENVSWICLEQIWIAVELGDRTLFLCGLYIPPDRVRDNDLIDAHCQSVLTILENASPTDDIIVLGDFNLPGILWVPSHSGFLYPDPERSQIHAGVVGLLDSYSSAMLTQINNVVNENNRTLDLCFVSTQDKAPFISVAPCPLAKDVLHHPPLMVVLENFFTPVCNAHPASVSYDFLKADHRSIVDVLTSIDWLTVLDYNNVESAARTFSHILAYVIDRHVPKRIHQGSRPPWFSTELRKLKSTKRAAFRNFSKYRTLPLRNHYVRLNHEYQRACRQRFARYQQELENKFKSKPKSFWKYVNDQRKESGLPSSMEMNGEIASTTQEICRLFAKKFASVFSDERISDGQVSIAAGNVPLNHQSLGAIDIDDDMIRSAAKQLKSSNNPGPDGVPSVFIKEHIDSLLVPLLLLFRTSLISGIFPSCWKFAHMFPVHKKGSKRDVDNYRGITSLSAVSKLFELVIMEPLLSHCKQLLSVDQHGFTVGRSTSTNLLCLTSYVTNSLTEKVQTDVIYTDLSAAFDKLNHSLAIAKLDRLGVGGSLLNWFRSYLSDRHLKVAIGDCTSESFHASSGIPQGSHLGPLIFLIYFNDVHSVIKSPRLSFADDLKIFLKIRSIADCHHLQLQLDNFANWCSMNRLVVNPTKCSVITFSRKKQSIVFNYCLLGSVIERVSHVKDLGVVLDSQLTFKQHISFIVDKSSRTLGFIFRIAKNFSDVYCLKSLYCSLVRSTLEYCSAIWSPAYNNGAERIESVQRRFLRFALRRLPWRDPFRLPSYESRCHLIDLELLRSRRDVARALMIADTLQGRVDCGAILEQIDLNVQPRSLRSSLMLRLPLRRTIYGMYGAISGLQRVFNRVASLFDFHVARDTLRRRFSSFFAGQNR